jgi:hypothetical protein
MTDTTADPQQPIPGPHGHAQRPAAPSGQPEASNASSSPQGGAGDVAAQLAAATEGERWYHAYELLYARLLRDLPNDGSEVPAPDDPHWAHVLDDILAFAQETYRAALGNVR